MSYHGKAYIRDRGYYAEPGPAVDGLAIVAAPLGGTDNASRERRVFGKQPNGNGGTCYGSHAVRLATLEEHRDSPFSPLFVVMSHGGGRERFTIRNGVAGGNHLLPILQSLDEVSLYSLLYSLSEAGRAAYEQGVADADAKWRKALDEGRVKKRRAKGGRAAFFDILSDWELPRKGAAA